MNTCHAPQRVVTDNRRIFASWAECGCVAQLVIFLVVTPFLVFSLRVYKSSDKHETLIRSFVVARPLIFHHDCNCALMISCHDKTICSSRKPSFHVEFNLCSVDSTKTVRDMEVPRSENCGVNQARYMHRWDITVRLQHDQDTKQPRYQKLNYGWTGFKPSLVSTPHISISL